MTDYQFSFTPTEFQLKYSGTVNAKLINNCVVDVKIDDYTGRQAVTINNTPIFLITTKRKYSRDRETLGYIAAKTHEEAMEIFNKTEVYKGLKSNI